MIDKIENKYHDKLKSFFGATDENVSDSSKIVNYIDQVKAGLHTIADLKDKLAEVSERQAKLADLFTALVTMLDEPTFLGFKKELEDAKRKM